jgi:hypothetical protein
MTTNCTVSRLFLPDLTTSCRAAERYIRHFLTRSSGLPSGTCSMRSQILHERRPIRDESHDFGTAFDIAYHWIADKHPFSSSSPHASLRNSFLVRVIHLASYFLPRPQNIPSHDPKHLFQIFFKGAVSGGSCWSPQIPHKPPSLSACRRQNVFLHRKHTTDVLSSLSFFPLLLRGGGLGRGGQY